jgi:capsular exopolysaccharide synthesis family protein
MAEYKVITNEDPHNTVSEQYRKLRTNIDFSSIDKEYKVINLTSTIPGEGKTVTCLNLAEVYAQTSKKTLIIDLDLRKPKIHRAFKLPNQGGIKAYIMGDKTIEEVVEQVDKNYYVLVAGEKIPFPSEVLISDKMKKMFEELRTMFDRIIIDCPPMTAVTDAAIISNLCDATVYVTASRHTNGDVAKDCIKELKQNGANIIGGVLTRVQKRDQSFGMEYYYYYGDN